MVKGGGNIMAKLKPGERIPKDLKGRYEEISEQLIQFSDSYLNDEYKELLLQALSKLCRKRPSPVTSGRSATWAAGIVHAVGSANFIFDKNSEFNYSADEIASYFGISKSTSGNQANKIRKLLNIHYGNAEWVLPSEMKNNSLIWMVSCNGFLTDARFLPLEMQIICYQKGLIPYIPALDQVPEESETEQKK